MTEEGRVHPDCRNASNPYHECSEYCFKIIAEFKKMMNKDSNNNTGWCPMLKFSLFFPLEIFDTNWSNCTLILVSILSCSPDSVSFCCIHYFDFLFSL